MIPTRPFAAFLFDMDGTVTDSLAATERVWTAWAQRHDLDVAAFLPTIHGVRAEETIRRQNLIGVDIAQEIAWVLAGEISDIEDVAPIRGAEAFLRALPGDRWAIVTSAQRDLAIARLTAAGLPIPAVLITAESVTQGKPAPDGYVLAARRLGVAPEACLVFEDAPAGVQAGEAAGAEVVVITAAHRHPFETAHATLSAYSEMRVEIEADSLRLAKI